MENKLEKLRIDLTCEAADSDGILHTYGVWHDIEKKYIGLKMEYPQYVIYGWLEVSITQVHNDYPLKINKKWYKKIYCANINN